MSKYRSLADVYGDNAFKPVPKLQRQVINETAKVYIQYDNEPNPKLIGMIDDKSAHNLSKQVANRSSGSFLVVNEMLKKSGWETGNKKEYIQKILNPVMTIIDETSEELNIQALRTFVTEKKSKNKFVEALIQSSKYDEIFSLINPLAEEAEDAMPATARETILELFDVNPNPGRVAIGKGEIAISLFSNGRQSKKSSKSNKKEEKQEEKGDLFFDGFGEVELKGGGGRPGTGGTAYKAAEKLSKIYSKYVDDDLIGKTSLTKLIENVRKLYIHEGKKAFANHGIKPYLEQKFTFNDKNDETGIKRKALQEIIFRMAKIYNDALNEKLKSQLEVDKILSSKENNQSQNLSDWHIDGLKQIIGNNQTFETLHKKITLFKNAIIDYINGLYNKSYNVKADKNTQIHEFFKDPNVPVDGLVEGFLGWACEDSYDTSGIKRGLKTILNDEIIARLRNGSTYDVDLIIRSIISAMQIVMYNMAEKYAATLFFNKVKGDYIGIAFATVGESTEKMLVNSFKRIYQLIESKILTVGLTVDKSNKGVSITLKS